MNFSRLTLWLPVFLMAILAILGYWIVQQLKEAGERPAILENEPDYIIHDFQISYFSTQGALNDVLYGQVITHFPDSKTGHLIQPILLHREAPPRVSYRTTSEEGFVDENLREVTLSKNVRAIRQPSNGPKTTLETDFVRYNETTGIIDTEHPTKVVSENNQFRSQGFIMDTQNDHLELLGPVTATYYRSSPMR